MSDNNLQLMQQSSQTAARKSRIFISYARKDGIIFTSRLYKTLTEQGFDVWFDQESMRSHGSAFPAELKRGIDIADYMLFISTPGALESNWVMQLELEYALKICRAIIPIIYKGGVENLPTTLSKHHAIDFQNCDSDQTVFKKGFEELVKRNLNYPPDAVTSKFYSDYSLRHHLYRSIEVQEIKELFLADEGLGRSPRIYKDSKKSIGLYGMGGVGKTVVLAELAGDCDVRRAFVDGVYWVTLGDIDEADREVRLTQAQSKLIMQLTGQEKQPNSVVNGTIELKGLLHDKKCLIILDDVWKPDQANVFHDILGEHCRMLMTTRDRSVLADLDVLEYEIKPLNDEDALELLARVSRKSVAELPPEAAEVVRLCKGLPLALTIIGANVRDSVETWDHYIDSLKKGDVTTLGDHHKSLYIVFDVSIEHLNRVRSGTNGQISDQILDLAIFPNDQPIPLQALERLWYSRYAPIDIHKILNFFADRSLVQRQGDNFIVHDLFIGFLRQTLGKRLVERHNTLLLAYNPDKRRWHDIIDDGYLYNHLVYHLEAADRLDDIHTLFQDKHWSEQRRNPLGLLSDFERAQQIVAESDTELRLRYSIFRSAIDETFSSIPASAVIVFIVLELAPPSIMIRVVPRIDDSTTNKLQSLLTIMALSRLTQAQKEACADAIIAVIRTWNNWTYEVSSSAYEKKKQTAIITLIHRVIDDVGAYPDRFRVLRRVLWKQAFSLADEERGAFLEQLLTPPLSDEDRRNFVQDVYAFQREGYDLDDQVSILKRIAPFQQSPEREEMWGHILNQLLPLWRESKWGIPSFYYTLGDLMPELTNIQRASIGRQIWEYWLIPDHHYSVPWKFLPEELFSVAWQKLENIREEGIGRFVEHIVPYIPDEMLPIIENKLSALAETVYSQDSLPRIKATLIRRNHRLSQDERTTAYLELVHEYIDRYRLTDLVKYIPQELTLRIWVLKLADYRDFRLNDERRRKNYGHYGIEKTLYLLIDRMPVEDVAEAIDCLLAEVVREDTLYTSYLDPKTTSDLCATLLSRLPSEDKRQKAKVIVEKAEIETQQEIESQMEKEYRGLNLSLLGYLITLLDTDMQIDYWARFFKLVASIKNRTRQALHIVGHLEHYPADQRLLKWQEAWQVVKAGRDIDYYSWGLESVIAGIPIVFGEGRLKDNELAMELAQATLKHEQPFMYGDRFARGWFGLAQIVLALNYDTAQALFSKFASRSVNPVLSCAFMPFLSSDQIDNLLIYRGEGAEGAMYHLYEEFLKPLSRVMAQWSGSVAVTVWNRSLDNIEQIISDRPHTYHPDFYMVWLRLLATAMPNYDVIAAWKHLLDHREVFWFNAWQELGAILIERLQPVEEDWEAIRIIWRDIQGLGEGTAALQSAIAPKLPTDILNTLRASVQEAKQLPTDIFICSLSTYIYHGGTAIKSNLEFGRRFPSLAGTSVKISRVAKLALWAIAALNILLYPLVYLYVVLFDLTKPIHKPVLLVVALVTFPLWFLFSVLGQIIPLILRATSLSFWFLRSSLRDFKGTLNPISEIVNIHRLSKSDANERFIHLLNQGSLADFASNRPLLQRIGGQKLRYVAHRAYQHAIEWWAVVVAK